MSGHPPPPANMPLGLYNVLGGCYTYMESSPSAVSPDEDKDDQSHWKHGDHPPNGLGPFGIQVAVQTGRLVVNAVEHNQGD